MKAPLPTDEVDRLKALHRYEILDSDTEQDFDDITLLASHICGTPIALISLLDENRQWFKSRVGTTASETSRDIAFCAHGILQTGLFVVNDARTDKRFSDNPQVTGDPGIRFYAGAPLITSDGHALGILCVKDHVPRELSAEQKAALQALSRQVVSQLELRRSMAEQSKAEQALKRAHDELELRVRQRTAELVQANRALQAENSQRKQAEQALQQSQKRLRDLIDGVGPSMFVGLLTPEGILIECNRPALTAAGLKPEDVLGKPFVETHWWAHSPILQRQLREAIARGARGESSRYDVRTRGVGDQVIDVDFSLHPLRNESGEVVFLVPSASVITERKLSEAALEKAHQELVAASRLAGMAEVATGVLHNVGNVLNSVNVASSCLADSLRRSKSANLTKVVALLREHEKDLGDFLTNDPKGSQVQTYLAQLAGHLAGEQADALKELAQLQKNIEHIKDIVSMQQGLAKTSAMTEIVSVTDLVEDALKMNLSALARHDIQIIKEFKDTPLVTVDKHKVLQILVNLVRNAKQACHALALDDRKLTIRTTKVEDRVRIAVCDNGTGILPENLIRIFSHGFTTKMDGHGFGLHGAAIAAKEMGGSLKAQSDGPGKGATFTLELPGVIN
jgi:PAS domain S-box-containing protein